MKHSNPIGGLIDKWPTRQSFASDIEEPVDRVHKWAQSGSIPQRAMSKVITAAGSRGIPLTAQQLIDMHSESQPKNAA